MSDSTEHPPLSADTVQQLRAAGWDEAKIAAAADRLRRRQRRIADQHAHDRVDLAVGIEPQRL